LKPKPEFPTLLPKGLHVFSEPDLYSLTVTGFKSSQRRQKLWDSLMQFCDELRDGGLIPCRLWLDGSFLTKKVDPDDIDIVVQASHKVVDWIPSTPDAITTRIDNREWYDEPRKLDTYLLTTWPAPHVMFVVGYEGWKYWEEEAFGRALISREEKGIAVLEVGP
jgi:hypothetical protein